MIRSALPRTRAQNLRFCFRLRLEKHPEPERNRGNRLRDGSEARTPAEAGHRRRRNSDDVVDVVGAKFVESSVVGAGGVDRPAGGREPRLPDHGQVGSKPGGPLNSRR